ncbi:mucin-binding protein [Lacticaseibacillus porcinae]|uniref:mucin-binding protein n=1 Tax=Lacticaseibacillus porcinae TaxID=1123687 RepID=UPI000F791D4E|nr:KxYKxGKxW signal peptide domain-containing protein [Lacticaseibacillus porcinae]
MQKETHRAHRKLARDTVDKRVRFRLYKSGRNWVIAGMTTLIFGIGIYSTPQLVKADTIDNAQTNGDESSIANQSSVTLQTPPAATEESSVAEPAVSDPDQTTGVAEQVVDTPVNQTATLQASISQPNTSAIQAEASVSTPENVSDNTTTSTVANPAVSQTTSATSEASGTATAVPAATTDAITQVIDSAQQENINPASTDANTDPVTPASVTALTAEVAPVQPLVLTEVQALAFDKVQLTPKIDLIIPDTDGDKVPDIISGTGTFPGDDIIIVSLNGQGWAATKVGPDGRWQYSYTQAGTLLGRNQSATFMVYESNSLGNLPGLDIAYWQPSSATETIKYVDALTNLEIQSPDIVKATLYRQYLNNKVVLESDFDPTVQGVISADIVQANTQALAAAYAKDPTVLVPGSNAANQLDSTLYFQLSGDPNIGGTVVVQTDWININRQNEYAAIDIADLQIPGYVTIASVEAQSYDKMVADENGVLQLVRNSPEVTVYYYPPSLIVDPNRSDDFAAGVVSPKDEMPINSADPNSPRYQGVSTDDLTRTITETITSVDAAGKAIVGQPLKTVTAYFTRTAKLDFTALDANGNPTVTYTEWVLKTIDGTEVADETDLSFPALSEADFSDIKGMNKVSTGVNAIQLTQDQVTAAVTNAQTNINQNFVYDYFALTPTIKVMDPSTRTVSGTGTLPGDDIIMLNKGGGYWEATTVQPDGTWTITVEPNWTDWTLVVYESNTLGDFPGLVMGIPTPKPATETIEHIDGVTGNLIDTDLPTTVVVTVYSDYGGISIVPADEYDLTVRPAWNKTISVDVVQANTQILAQVKAGKLSASAANAPYTTPQGAVTNVFSSLVGFSGQIQGLKDIDGGRQFAAISNEALNQIDGYTTSGSVDPIDYYIYDAGTFESEYPSAVVNNPTVKIYYYPTTLTIDPNAPDDGLSIPGTITPKDEDVVLNSEDPNSPKYPAGISTSDLTKTITRTIYYVNEAGDAVAPDATTSLYYTRTAALELHDDETTSVAYTDWVLKTITTNGIEAPAGSNDNGFVAVKSPQVMISSEELIPNQFQITAVNVTDAIQGNNGRDALNYNDIADTVIYYPATVTVSQPTVEGTAVAGGDDPRLYPAITAADLSRAINETIHYVYVDANGNQTGTASPDYLADPIEFSQTAQITYAYDDDGVLTNNVTYSGWSATSDSFAAVESPKITDYTSTGDVDAVKVSEDSSNIEKTVGYFSDADLTHTVRVTTNYGLPVDQTMMTAYQFYRQPTQTFDDDGTTTFGFTTWTTNIDGISTNVADQSIAIPAIDASKNPNSARWKSATTVTVDGVARTDAVNGAITLTPADTQIRRDVVYTDQYMHIIFVDMDNGGAVVNPDQPIFVKPGSFITRSSDYSETVSTPAGEPVDNYYIDPAGIVAEAGTMFGEEESFTGLAGGTYTIELRHTHVTAPIQTNRIISYVFNDGTEASPTITQTADWKADTDVVVYQTDPAKATTYHLDTGYPALDSPTVTNFTPDVATVVAQASVADTSDVPQNTTVKVTYVQTTFTPDAPGSYGANLTYEAVRQISYVNGANGDNIAATVPQTVTYQRTYVIDNLVDNTGHYTNWTTDKATFDAVTNPAIPNFVTIEADVAEKAVPVPSDDAQVSVSDPEVVKVKYYPTTITVTADSPKDEGEPTVAGDANSPQYPAGVAENDLNLTVTRTIHYVDVNGDPSTVMPEDTIQIIKFTRDATITYSKDVTGNFASSIEYSPWTAVDGETLVAVRPPDVTGLIAGVYQVDAISVPASTITDATKSEYSETVNYYLQNIDVTPDTPHDSGNKDNDSDNVIPGDPTSPEYPTGVALNDLNKQITQTINYVDESGTALIDPATGESSATVTKDFQRTAHIHYAYDAGGVLVGIVTYDDWNVETFDNVDAPAIDGYVAPAGQVPTIDKTGDDTDFNSTIKYFNTDLLQRAVTVTTEYAAYTDNNGTNYPAHSDEVQTVIFHRLPTFENGNFGFTVWTTNVDGQTTSQADQSQTIAAIDLTVVNALDTDTNPNGNSFIATEQTTIKTLNDPELSSTEQTLTREPTQTSANTAVVVDPTMASVTRVVSYADNAYHIKFIDVTGLDVADYATKGTQLGVTQNVGPSYQMDTADIPHWGLLKLVNDPAALAGEGDGARIESDGSESFTGVNGQTYRIEVVHLVDNDPLTTTRTIDYVKAGEGVGSAAQSVVQTIDWTKNTDLYIQATGDATMPVTININPNGVFYNQADQTAVVPAVKSPLTAADETDSQQVANDLGEYLPDVTEVAAIAPISGFFKEEPKDSTVTVTYTRNIFTTDNPGTDGTAGAINKLQATVNRTIDYVNGLDPTQKLAESVVQPVTYTRTYNAQTNAYSDWILKSGDSYPEQVTPPIPGYLTAVVSTPGATPTGTLAPDTDLTTVQESVVVKYYPEKVVINPADSVTAGDSINTDHPEDTDAPVYPATVTDTDLSASVTQTITYVDGSTGETVSQVTDHIEFKRTTTVTFVRDASGQLVGTLSYDPWQNADDKTSFPAVPTPERTDQFADQLSIAATTVSASDLDAATAATGKVDVTALNAANTHTVTYWPNTVTVTPGAPDAPDKSGKPSDPTKPDSPLLPAGVDYGDLHSIVTQIIAFVDSHDGSAVHEPATATLIFERTAFVHYDQRDANGVSTVTYSDWIPVAGGSDKFVATDNPTGVSDADGVALQAATKQSVEQKVDLTTLTTEASTINQTVNYYPTTITVTPDAPHDSGEATGGVDSPLYPAGVDDDALHATVTEVIKYVDGSGVATVAMPETYTTAKVYQRTATITYDADWQPSVSYSDWKVASGDDLFAAVSSPDVTDMWADPATITEQTVDVATIPTTAIDNDGTELSFEVKYYPTTITVDPHDPKTEGTPTQTDPESPKYPAGVDTKALNTTVTQIIHYVDQRDGGTTTTADHTATLNFVRTATITFAKDGTTQVDYSAWTPDLSKAATEAEIAAASTFIAVENPTLTTATSDQLSLIVGASDATTAAQEVDLATVLPNNQTILTTDVLYYPAVIIVEPDAPKQAGEATIPGDANSPKYPEGVSDTDLTHEVTRVIQYINKQTGEVLGTETQTAVATRSAAITYQTLDGAPTIVYSPWKINGELDSVASPEYPDLYAAIPMVEAQAVTTEDFDVSRNFADVIVAYYPTKVTVTSEDPKDAGTSVVEGDDQGPKYPAGVGASDLTHDVVRQINYVDAQGNVLDTTSQTSTYTRDAALVYTGVTEKPTITYSDWTGKFEFDSVVNPVIEGYYTLAKDVEKQVVTAADVDANRVFEVSVKYYVSDVTVTADDPKDAGTPVVEGDVEGPKYPAGVSASDLNHTVVRKINYVDVQGKVLATEVQTLTFKRDANLVYTSESATPTITYTDWTGDFELVGVANPTISGYYTLDKDVEAQTVTVADVDASRIFEATVKYYQSSITVTADDPKDAGTPVIDGDDAGPKYPEGVSASDLTHQVTRQIAYVNAQGNVLNTKEQTEFYTRDAALVYTADSPTPTITYTDWQGNFELEGVSNPTIPGFFTSASDVGPQVVTTNDVEENHGFNVEVKYYAAEVKVTPDDPKDAGAPVIEGDDVGPKYPEGVSASDLTHQVIRQINYVDTQGNVLATKAQTQTYTREAVLVYSDVNTAPTITYSDWSGTFSLDGVENPAISGYYTLAKNVEALDVTVADVEANRVVEVAVKYYASTVNVTADDPKDAGTPVIDGDNAGPKYPEGVSASDLTHTVVRQISYVDAQGKVLGTKDQTLTFKRDAALVYTADSPTPTITYTDWTGNFDFVSVENPAFSGYFTQTSEVESQTVTKDDVEANKVFETVVKYYATDVKVTADDPKDAGMLVIDGDDSGPKYPEGVSASDLTHQVVRQIQYVDVQGNVLDTNTQTLVYTRDADLVYSAESATPTITYTDWAGTFEFEGIANPPISGFFTPNSGVETQPVTKSDVDASHVFNETVTYYASEVKVTADDPKDAGTLVIDGDDQGPKYPEGVSASDLTHTVVRQISYVDPQGNVLKTDEQTLTFTRDALLDFSDGKKAPTITYTNWSGDFEFGSVTNPSILGYFTLAKDVQPQSVSTDDVDNSHVFNETVIYYATEVKVTADDPKDAGTPVIDGDEQGPKYPEGVSASDLTHTVVRQISYVDIDGNILSTKEQSLSFTRDALVTFDDISGEPTITYTDWRGDFEIVGVANPSIPNYFTLADDVGEQVVTQDDVEVNKLFAVVVTYYPAEVKVTAEDPKDVGTLVIEGDEAGPKYPAGVSDSDLTHQVVRQIKYVDAQGNVLGTKEQTQTFTRDAILVYINGSESPTITYTDWIGNFELAAVDNPTISGFYPSKSGVDAQVVLPSDVDASRIFDVTVKYYASEVTVTADDPKDAGTPVVEGDDQGPKYPEGVSASDLTHQVVRKINYVDPQGNVLKTAEQTLTFTRNAQLIYTDGITAPTIIYTDWSGDFEFAGVTNPVITGYYTSAKDVEAQDVVVSDVESNRIFNVTVKYYATEVTVTPENPKDAGTPVVEGDDQGPKYPEGVSASDLNKTITQTIKYVDQAGKPVAEAHIATISFTRTAKIVFDAQGNATVSYSAWTPVTSGTFAAVTSPVINGMTTATKGVNAQVADPDADDTVTTVTYTAVAPVPQPTPNPPALEPKTPAPQVNATQTVTPAPVAKPNVKPAALPQMGDEQAPTTSIIGVILATLMGIFGLAGKKRRKDE